MLADQAQEKELEKKRQAEELAKAQEGLVKAVADAVVGGSAGEKVET